MNRHRLSRGHTQNYLRQLLTERGLAPRSSLGQCFLTDLNLLDILVDAAELSGDDLVLEVGSGTGSLTLRLAARARAVLSVEIDPGLFELACDTTRALPNVRTMHADILSRKSALNPEVLTALDELARSAGARRLKLVANLPFVVATPVISLFLTDERRWDRFVVTIQKELADRLMAKPSTKDYGSISVIAQSLADVRLVRLLPATAFWPRPKVSSAFMLITPRPPKREVIHDLPAFCRFTRRVMSHRRKVLRAALKSTLCGIPKSEIDGFLVSRSIDPQVRAESLPPEELVRLANSLPPEWLSPL